MMAIENLLGRALVILLVEDNPDHTELIVRCLEHHRLTSEIHHVTDGEAALDYLFRRGPYAAPPTSPRPHVVILDLRLPKIDGLEVLRQVKETEELRKVPIVVLTSSEAEGDVAKAYYHHANSYLVKPLDAKLFAQVIDDLGYYWMGWNHCPWSWQPHY
jgi:CheY-like chemotaxis protein